jgi:molecular chaperone DnaK
MGAALLAESGGRVDSVVLIDVLAMGIGVGLPGGRMMPLLPRNTTLPAKRSHEIATTRDGQGEIELHVFQGDSPRVPECEYLGAVRIAELAQRPRGEVRVAFEFAVSGEGLLTVTARELDSGKTTVVQLATRDTPEALRAKLLLPQPQTAPAGARPAEAAPAAPARKGLFGRLFGGRA